MKMKRFWHAGTSHEASVMHAAGRGFSSALFAPVSTRSAQWVMGDAGFSFPLGESCLGFRDVWAASGEFPLPARRLIESDARFAGFDVVLGLVDDDAPGVAVLLRSHGHLASLHVLEAAHGMLPIDAEIDAGLADAFAHAERFCAHAAILLIHAPAAWPGDLAAYATALAARGVADAMPNRLYSVGHGGSHVPTVHIGWIGEH